MRLLLIEDEHELARNVQRYLILEKYAVDVAFDGADGLEKALTNDYDCVILDLNLPKLNGEEVCRALREEKNTTPVIMLTARAGTENVVSGLDLGADDYLTKPFDMPELLARIRAIIRRKSDKKSPVLTVKNITLDTNTQRVTKDGFQINLAPKEYILMEYLLRHAGRALKRTSIISHVWGAEEDQLLFSQTLDVHIAYLRKKLGKDIITTIPGSGYMISDDA